MKEELFNLLGEVNSEIKRANDRNESSFALVELLRLKFDIINKIKEARYGK